MITAESRRGGRGLRPALTTPDLIAEALRLDIRSGVLLPGASLRQDEIAHRFSVSRIPVREALRLLEADGYITIEANRGSHVRCYSSSEIEEIYDLRLLLEPDLLKHAISYMQRDDLDRIETIMMEAELGAGQTGWRDLDHRFHEALYAPAGRDHQLAIVMRLRSTVIYYQAADASLFDTRDRWVKDHRGILQACRRKDSKKAAEILEAHLKHARALTLKNLTT